MTKEEFMRADQALCMIVSLDPDSGKVIYDTYDLASQDYWLDVFKKDFPKMMHFTTVNPSAIRERKKMFGL